MKTYELTNGVMNAKIRTLGAELISLQKCSTGQEYMWKADLEYWSRVSPVLFPFVGKLKNQQYSYNGTVYCPKPHGFARDMVFAVIEKEEDRIVLEITDSEETMKVYPFQFVFRIAYKLEGESLNVSFLVINKGENDMYFSLGAHPGFACPLREDENRKDCYIGFDYVEKLNSRGVDIQTGLVNGVYREYPLENGLLSIADNMFENDALVLEKQGITTVTLYDKEKVPYLSLKMDAPVYGIWSAAKEGAPFVCIEPWFGRCDASDFVGKLEEREYQTCLEAGEKFESYYVITVI